MIDAIDVCEACGRKAPRVNSPSPAFERGARAEMRRFLAASCPRTRSENRLPCPMAQEAWPLEEEQAA